MAILSCCQQAVDPPKPMGIPSDLKDTQVRFLPFGGDPRGTYYPNTPLIILSGDVPSPLDFFAPTVNGGSGKLIIEGGSSMSGTWRAENIVFQYDGVLKNGASPYPISTTNHDTLAAFFAQKSGRWGVNPNYKAQIVFSNQTSVEDFPFTADSLGMYLYTSPPRISYPPRLNTILCTTIFKKQR